MAKLTCKYCQAVLTDQMLESGEAIKVGTHLCCIKCKKNTRKRSRTTHASRRISSNESLRTQQAIDRNQKRKSTKSKPHQIINPDISFGEDLARTSKSYRPRATSAHRTTASQKMRSKRMDAQIPQQVSQIKWLYIISGIGLLLLSTTAILYIPTGNKIFTTNSSHPDENPSPNETASIEDTEKFSDKDLLIPNTNSTPVRVNLEPDRNEAAVVMMSDLDVGAEERFDRRAWRLKQGQPNALQNEIMLGSFETPIELLNWTFEPRGEIRAWLGTKGVTHENKSLRLKLGPQKPGNTELYFNLKLQDGVYWNWSGATELACDLYNPTLDTISVRLALTYFDGKTSQKAEWPFDLKKDSNRKLRCPLNEDRIRLDSISDVGLIITRPKKDSIILYMDKLTVAGTFETQLPAFKIPKIEP